MKKLFLIQGLLFAFWDTHAQVAVNISGQIDNLNAAESIYLGIDGGLFPLNPTDEGTFSLDVNISEFPSSFYFADFTKKGKIEQKTPMIWFESDSVQITKNWTDQTYQMQGLLPFQSTSEKIEALETKDQINFILSNPNSFPSLFFANKNKEKISISDLEKLSMSIDDDHKNSGYLKRIESYVSAKKRNPLRKDNKVEDFKLLNKEGQYISVVKNDNKPRLIALFSSGCSYSISSINLLEQLAEFNNDKIEIITIWDDQTKETWLNTNKEKKDKITWTNLWDEYGFASTYLNRTMWPIFYVINEDGILTEIIKGYDKKTAQRLKELVD